MTVYYRGDTPIEHFEYLDQILEHGGCGAFDNILTGTTLAPFQTMALAFGFFNKSALLCIDTGLGKTLIAIGYCRLIKAYTKKKLIFVVENNNLNQTQEKFERYSNLRTIIVDGKKDTVLSTIMKDPIYDVYIVSYQGIKNFMLNQYLVAIKSHLAGIIVDECQSLGDLNSDTSQIITAISDNLHYKLFLSATPMRKEPEQYLNVLHALDTTFIGKTSVAINPYRDVHKDGTVTYHDLEDLYKATCRKVLIISRSDVDGAQVNYKPDLIYSEATPQERKVKGRDMLDLKGNKDSEIVQKLIFKLKDLKYRGKRGLIFCNTNRNKAMLQEALTQSGLITDILDGTHTNTNEKKEIVKQRFVNKELDCLITNARTGLDLECDYIMFWEFTLDTFQVLGRGQRGLKGKDMLVYFCIVNGTVEINYFKTNVLERAEYLEQLFGRNISVLREAFNDMLKHHQY